MKYILYARKSTEKDDRQVLSIEAQLVELQKYAAQEKFEIVASLCEAKTAKEPGRIKFAEMLAILESGKADGIISWHPNRLARNSVDGGKIIHFVDRGLIKSLKIQYKLVAERSEANLSNLQFPMWCAHEESNFDLRLRKPSLYPLSYGRNV